MPILIDPERPPLIGSTVYYEGYPCTITSMQWDVVSDDWWLGLKSQTSASWFISVNVDDIDPDLCLEAAQ